MYIGIQIHVHWYPDTCTLVSRYMYTMYIGIQIHVHWYPDTCTCSTENILVKIKAIHTCTCIAANQKYYIKFKGHLKFGLVLNTCLAAVF